MCTPEKAAAIVKTIQSDSYAADLFAAMVEGDSLLGKGHRGKPGRNQSTQTEETMQIFSISHKDNRLGEVKASDHQQAADRWARRQHGRKASALLVQGETGKSGLYQAYKPARGGGQSSVGENFNVRD